MSLRAMRGSAKKVSTKVSKEKKGSLVCLSRLLLLRLTRPRTSMRYQMTCITWTESWLTRTAV